MKNYNTCFKPIIFLAFYIFSGFGFLFGDIISQSNDKATLKGYIQMPAKCRQIPKFRIFFEGYQTYNNSEGFFSFPLSDKSIDKYYVLIYKNVNQNFDNINTLGSLSTNPDKSYKFFSCKKTTTNDDIVVWQPKEKKLDKKNFVVPKNCLILSFSPKYFDSIENWNVSLADNFVRFPKIILRDDVKKKKIKRESVKSLLYSLDAATFHEPIKESKKKIENSTTLVSLSQ